MAKKSSATREIEALLKRVAKAVKTKAPQQKKKWDIVDGAPSQLQLDDDEIFNEAKKRPHTA